MHRPTVHEEIILRAFVRNRGFVPADHAKTQMVHLMVKGLVETASLSEAVEIYNFTKSDGKQRIYRNVKDGWRLSREGQRSMMMLINWNPDLKYRPNQVGPIFLHNIPMTVVKSRIDIAIFREWCFLNDVVVSYRSPGLVWVETEHEILYRLRWS